MSIRHVIITGSGINDQLERMQMIGLYVLYQLVQMQPNKQIIGQYANRLHFGLMAASASICRSSSGNGNGSLKNFEGERQSIQQQRHSTANSAPESIASPLTQFHNKPDDVFVITHQTTYTKAHPKLVKLFNCDLAIFFTSWRIEYSQPS